MMRCSSRTRETSLSVPVRCACACVRWWQTDAPWTLLRFARVSIMAGRPQPPGPGAAHVLLLMQPPYSEEKVYVMTRTVLEKLRPLPLHGGEFEAHRASASAQKEEWCTNALSAGLAQRMVEALAFHVAATPDIPPPTEEEERLVYEDANKTLGYGLESFSLLFSKREDSLNYVACDGSLPRLCVSILHSSRFAGAHARVLAILSALCHLVAARELEAVRHAVCAAGTVAAVVPLVRVGLSAELRISMGLLFQACFFKDTQSYGLEVLRAACLLLQEGVLTVRQPGEPEEGIEMDSARTSTYTALLSLSNLLLHGGQTLATAALADGAVESCVRAMKQHRVCVRVCEESMRTLCSLSMCHINPQPHPSTTPHQLEVALQAAAAGATPEFIHALRAHLTSPKLVTQALRFYAQLVEPRPLTSGRAQAVMAGLPLLLVDALRMHVTEPEVQLTALGVTMHLCSESQAYIHAMIRAGMTELAMTASNDARLAGSPYGDMRSTYVHIYVNLTRIMAEHERDCDIAVDCQHCRPDASRASPARVCAKPGCFVSEKLKYCSACKQVRYCGAVHQKEHWAEHKRTCAGRRKEASS